MWLSPERVRALPSSRVLEGLSEHAVEGLVQREEGRAEDAGVPAEVARHDLEPARGQRRSPAVDHLAHSRQQRLLDAAEAAANDDRGGVEEVDDRGEYLADEPAGRALALIGHR